MEELREFLVKSKVFYVLSYFYPGKSPKCNLWPTLPFNNNWRAETTHLVPRPFFLSVRSTLPFTSRAKRDPGIEINHHLLPRRSPRSNNQPQMRILEDDKAFIDPSSFVLYLFQSVLGVGAVSIFFFELNLKISTAFLLYVQSAPLLFNLHNYKVCFAIGLLGIAQSFPRKVITNSNALTIGRAHLNKHQMKDHQLITNTNGLTKFASESVT